VNVEIDQETIYGTSNVAAEEERRAIQVLKTRDIGETF
jgi:hypothetical protein